MTVELRLLASRVADGDATAFRPIVDATRGQLYRLAARLMGDLRDAEDALQDAYVNAYRAISEGKYDGRAKIETWLYRIVTNACIDLLRKRKPTRDTDSLSASGGALEPRFDGQVSAEARVALHELDELLADFSPQDRAALVLVSVEGCTVKEAADVLGLTEGAVEQRLVRSRAALRKAHREAEVADG